MTTNEPMKPRVPYELIPTSLPGVFISPPPPANFDPNTASPEELIKYGFPWPRPGEKDPLALHTAWERFSRQWCAADYIVPEFEQIGETHPLQEVKPIRDVKQVAKGSHTNSTWAGAVVVGNWTEFVQGAWKIPKVRKPGTPPVAIGVTSAWRSLSWVGLDGWGSREILQIGVVQDFNTQDEAFYYPFYEWFAPGDQQDGTYSNAFLEQFPYIGAVIMTNIYLSVDESVYCFVKYDKPQTIPPSFQSGKVSFTSDSYKFSLTLQPPSTVTMSAKSAEWIMEPPGGILISSLPAFDPVNFEHCMAVEKRYSPDSDAYYYVLGNPGSPDPVGNTFNIQDPRDGTMLTSVTTETTDVANWTMGKCTINYIGP